VKVYLVGGAIRDELLGLPVKERDYVVVGATPEDIEKMLRDGFKPVGKDFPVFLHPQTHEEYALARTERKTGHGYKGFKFHASPEVTLEEDLKRRDLTINAMARPQEGGALIDRFGGERDLEARLLRHVSDAFAEDPVRILRVARFAARFGDRGFEVAPPTMKLMQDMVRSGEADYLVPERVWQEFARGLAEPRPDLMLEVLRRSGLLGKMFPEIKDWPKRFSGSVPVRFAHLVWPLDEGEVDELCTRLRVPGDVRELAQSAVARNKHLLTVQDRMLEDPRPLLQLLQGTDAFRRPERFAEFLQVVRLAAPTINIARIQRALEAARTVDAGAIAAKAASQSEIPKLLDEARLRAIRALC
jgi:tRNA nucleotidyltransferase (CCA-adding enzyme)